MYFFRFVVLVCNSPQDFDLRSTLSEFVCGPKCPYFNNIHPIGARAHGMQYNAAAIPRYLAEEVAEHVNAKFYMQRIRKVPAVELSAAQIAEFNAAMTDLGQEKTKKKNPGSAKEDATLVTQSDSDSKHEEEKEEEQEVAEEQEELEESEKEEF